jgi:hypothetical protein
VPVRIFVDDTDTPALMTPPCGPLVAVRTSLLFGSLQNGSQAHDECLYYVSRVNFHRRRENAVTNGFERTILDVDVQTHIRRAHALRSRYMAASLRALIRAVRRRMIALSRRLLLRKGRPSNALRSGYPSLGRGQP